MIKLLDILLKQTKYTNKQSISFKLRNKRIEFFQSLVKNYNIKNIIDIGGTQLFWNNFNIDLNEDMQITLLNLHKQETNKNFKSVVGDATDMHQYKNKEFDLVFSNSVLEHVGDYDNQVKMGNEVNRIGKKYFIQTPNKYFPIEPHFLFPFFQFLPKSLKIFLIRHYNLGNFKKTPEKDKAEEIANSIRLISQKELKSIFPEGKIYKEKVFGITKSFIVYNL